jgi:hypothetical protein
VTFLSHAAAGQPGQGADARPLAFGRNTGPAAVAGALVRAQVVRFRMLLTCCADHSAPPRAVGTRIRVNSAAMARSDLAPRAWMLRDNLDFLDDRPDRRGVAIGLCLHRLDPEAAEPVHVADCQASCRGPSRRRGPALVRSECRAHWRDAAVFNFPGTGMSLPNHGTVPTSWSRSQVGGPETLGAQQKPRLRCCKFANRHH